MKRNTHRNLETWKVSMELVEEVYRITKAFPSHEQFGLVSQMRRAAVSVPSNIAEGAARYSDKEFANFINIARGSLSELETQTEIAVRIGLLQHHDRMTLLLNRAGKLLTGLHRKLKEASVR